MASWIHGIRTWQFSRCSKTELPVLVGQAGQHLHNRVQKAAECRGISGALWMTEAARERLDARTKGGLKVPHEGPAPDWNCTCGHFFYRTFKDAWVSDQNAYAHVTCLERTMLHKNGGRTTQYSVDYFVAPTKDNLKVYLPIGSPEQAQGQKITPFPYGPYGGYYGGMMMAVERDQREVMEEIALGLGVPILDQDDLKGCPDCLIANSWREEKEISEEMRRDWYGDGYRQQERNRKWKEALDEQKNRTPTD